MKKVLMSLLLMPLMALADSEKVGDVTWSYVVENDRAMVTGVDPSSGAIEIPSMLNGYPVTSIGESAFYDCSGLTSVTIPESVTCIGANAFFRCGNMTNVMSRIALTHPYQL